jgi:hypothetical protein
MKLSLSSKRESVLKKKKSNPHLIQILNLINQVFIQVYIIYKTNFLVLAILK